MYRGKLHEKQACSKRVKMKKTFFQKKENQYPGFQASKPELLSISARVCSSSFRLDNVKNIKGFCSYYKGFLSLLLA
jgi:hypothetical protein